MSCKNLMNKHLISYINIMFSLSALNMWPNLGLLSILNHRIESAMTNLHDIQGKLPNPLIPCKHPMHTETCELILAIKGLKWVHEKKISTSDAKPLFHKSHPSIFCGPLQPLHPLNMLDFIQLFIHWPFVLIQYLSTFKAMKNLTIWDWMKGFSMKVCKGNARLISITCLYLTHDFIQSYIQLI